MDLYLPLVLLTHENTMEVTMNKEHTNAYGRNLDYPLLIYISTELAHVMSLLLLLHIMYYEVNYYILL